MRSPQRRLAAIVRLIHPFPSLLDGAATVAIALLAGGDLLTAARLGGSMLALQASIGALNDLIDSSADAGRKTGKPIPLGLVAPGTARLVVVIGAATGLLLAGPSGPVLLGIAAAGLGVGYGYNVWANGTAWSWVPFAIGVPLLPVFAWYGATGSLPGQFAVLLPAAILAGTALAIANARADLERDMAVGRDSVATRLGHERAWRLSAVLFAVVLLMAFGALALWGVPPIALGATTITAGVISVGLVWARAASSSAARREQAWEIQASGVALLAAAWLAALGNLR